jgi:hypothetical protein
VEIALEMVAWSLRQHWACGLPIICFIFLMCLPAFRDTAQNPEDHDRWLKRLSNNSRAERYCSVLRDWLNLLDSRLSSHEAHQGPAQKA